MKVDNWIRIIEEVVCTLSLAVIITLVIVQVFYRYVLSSGILWIDELVTNLMVLMVMFGAALATRNNVHTNLQVLIGMSPRKLSLVLKAFAALVVALFLLILIFYSALHAYNSRNLTTIMIELPLWAVYGFIPLGGILTFYEFIKKIPETLFTEPLRQNRE